MHLEILSSKLRRTNSLISKLRHFAPRSMILQFYYAFFESHMRYACQIWGQSLRIFKLQKSCVRLISFSNFMEPSSLLFLSFKILKLSDLVKLLNIEQNYSVLSHKAPLVLNSIYNLKRYPGYHYTRVFSLGLLSKPHCNTSRFGLDSVVYKSIDQWNELQLIYPDSDLPTLSKIELVNICKGIIFNNC